MKNQKILVADDHLLVRMGIRALMQQLEGYEIVAEAENGTTALEKLRDEQYDIALIDIAMPDISGIEVVQRIRRFDSQVKLIYLSALNTAEIVQAAFATSANGFLLKDFMLGELEQALNMVSRGEIYLSPRLLHRIPQENSAKQEAVLLTTRQIEILRGIASGSSNKEIARELGISPKTVDYHRSQLMKRLDLHDIASLTLYAVRHGLFPST
jgi:DNA-binding NarL/FixJ family response regulator